jgi:hypothetical protein
MKKQIVIILLLLIFSTANQYGQNYLKVGSPIIGEWILISPKNSPGPEFVVETYIGIGVFKLASGENISMAAASYDKEEAKYKNAAEFIAEWDGTRLTGIVSVSNWPKVTDPLKINVPMEYDEKKDRIIIHINNSEYGDVKFIYKRVKK